MRITNQTIQQQSLTNLQRSLRQVDEAQRRVTSGLRLEKASDDPSGAAAAMRARREVRALEQYQRNIGDAAARAATEESVLDRVTEVLTRAKELAVSQGSATANAATRQATKIEVDALLDFAVSLGNTQHGGTYLFGGRRADEAPFDATRPDYLTRSLADPPTGSPEVEISAGRYLRPTHDGQETFIDTGVLAALKELSDALVDPTDPAGAVRTAAASLEDSFVSVQILLGETGGRISQMEATSAHLELVELNQETLRSSIEEADIQEAVTALVARQTAYQTAMLATSRVLGMSLSDYLR